MTGVVFGAKLIDLPNLTMNPTTVEFGGELFLIIPSYFCSGIDLAKAVESLISGSLSKSKSDKLV